jgi:hypothetical protein
MFKLKSVVKVLLVALALVGTTALSTFATAATQEAQSNDGFYYKHTGGVPPQ